MVIKFWVILFEIVVGKFLGIGRMTTKKHEKQVALHNQIYLE